MATAAVSYRLDEALKRELAHRSAAEGVTESALVTRLLSEGLKTAAHPGIVYRGGPSGRRAGIAGGPDVAEVLAAVQHAAGAGERKVAEAAEHLGLPTHIVRLAVTFAAAHPAEIEARIVANADAAEGARRHAAERERLIAS